VFNLKEEGFHLT